MKLRVIDRLLAALAGLVLIVLAVVPVADTLLGTGMLNYLAKVAEFKTVAHVVFMLGGGLILLLVGLMLLHLAVRRVKHKGFVVQTTDVGELSISIRAIEDLVNRCVEKHDEVHVNGKSLENTRDGLVINLRVGLATGVNIPLAVSALQKQIKQYVTACSGVDVSEVKVQVDATSTKAKPSIYAVSEVLENAQPLPREEEKVPEIPAEPEAAEVKEPEEKCLHQRLFGEEEQPAIVPAPPVEEAVEEPETPAEEAVAAVEEPASAEENDEEEKVTADEVIEAWEKAEEEAAEAAASAVELQTLADLTDEIAEEAAEETIEPEEADETEAFAEYEVDAESIVDLEALDGAKEAQKPEDAE
ncbi:MAG: alkaline shock response membrane anchor protein AmaP [Clostridia bacterium]|nr:alkaline shock response membrane anchor protein AmaP [Clostridia bacterium]